MSKHAIPFVCFVLTLALAAAFGTTVALFLGSLL